MSFFKRIFNKEEQARRVEHVDELLIKDIIQLTDSFALPEMLRGQQFQVSAINSYEYEHQTDTEWVLSGNNNVEIYLGLDVDDQTYLKFSLKIHHEDVETLFDLDQFSTLFDEPGDAILDHVSDNGHTAGWTDSQYQQSIFARVGYFHRKDHRTAKLSQFEGQDAGEQFELYQLLNADQTKGVEAEVWSDGDTDIFLTFYRPTTDIIDMFPGS